VLAVAIVASLATFLVWRRSQPTLPGPGSQTYEDTSRAFYRGLAALEVGLLENAVQDFSRASDLVPAEPASWANLGVARLRLGDLDAASAPIAKAMSLAPENADLLLLAARMEAARGRLDEAIAYFRRAVALDPRGLKARFALAEELERLGTPESDSEALRLLDELLTLAPTNIAVLLERARLAAKLSDSRRLADSLTRLENMAKSWPPIAIEQYEALKQAAQAGNMTQAARATALLRNVLARVPAFTADIGVVRTPAEIVAEPFQTFLLLAEAESTPAPADLAVRFTSETLDTQAASAVVAFSLDGNDPPVLFAADRSTIRRLGDPKGIWPFAGGAGVPTFSAVSLLALDWNNDFRVDVLAAGSGGVRLLLQRSDGGFEDGTAVASASSPVSCMCQGAWAADVEMDGDLDVVLGVQGGATMLLRNNGDGKWTTQQTFASVPNTLGFAWADLDRDGDPDAVFLSGEDVHIFMNGRAGMFAELKAPASLQNVVGLTVADVNADGAFDVVATTRSESIRRASIRQGGGWDEQELVAAPAPREEVAFPVSMFAADLDNNGAIDLVLSGGTTRIWLADQDHGFKRLPDNLDVVATAIVDLDDDGRLDLVGTRGTPVRLLGRGERPYHWKDIRVRAQATAGDQRINPFAVGGEIDLRSGLLRQKQLLTGAPAHFGLGTRTAIDVARIVWPNGVPQAEFGEEVDRTVIAEQRLKGSCPWVFAYNGTEMTFVTDFLWRSPLGLRINAQDTAGVNQTEDWVRIRGDQLVPRDGFYDVRITAELWETHFFDHVSLMAVDHPEGAEVYVDERFSSRPVTFAVQALADVSPVIAARDQTGRDVTDLVSHRDGRYLASVERGRYQGIAKEHSVEFELSDQAARPPGRAGEGRLVLVAQGWVYPTDSSINVAVGQGHHEGPRGVALDVQGINGRWTVVNSDLGFPAGKNKTMLIDLRGVTKGRRLRLRTNMEVYWDSLASAVTTGDSMHISRVAAAKAELVYRGFSRTVSQRSDAPETPIYAPIVSSGQRWRDLVGYYTRFGDVRELLMGVDDRYVIMNAGDELSMRFPVPAGPAAGWRRDFVLVGDGWEKDGDYNTEFSQTVLPLPMHRNVAYDAASPPVELEDDPVYRRHRNDWDRYHTRYVTPDRFAKGSY
jgi:tetratricopeptide (TPR) repeat protein